MRERFWRRTTGTPDARAARDQAEHPHSRLRALMFAALVGFGLAPALSMGLAGLAADWTARQARQRDGLEALVRNRAATVATFLDQRLRQLEFLAAVSPVAELQKHDVLEAIRAEMAREGGGVVDLGLIDAGGRHLAYAGPYDLLGKDYRGQPWFERVLVLGRYQSDLFLGYRQFPHIVVAVRKREGGRDFLLRATIDVEQLGALVRDGSAEPGADVFILNRAGEHQTASRFRRLMEKADVVPPPHAGVRVAERAGNPPELIATAWLPGSNWVVVGRVPRPSAWAAVSRGSPLLSIAVAWLVAVPLLAFGLSRYGHRRVQALEEERAALYESVAQSEKLAAIGRLATTTAHEINNPLAIIDAQVGLLKDLLLERGTELTTEELQARLAKIAAQVQRGKTVTHRLLGFSRRVGPLFEAVDLVAALDETVSFVEKQAEDSRVRLVRDYARGIPLVRSNLGQMQQVFLNVVSNAIDAVNRDGEVLLAIRCGRGGVEVEVSDTGPGIAEADLERVFEPFYSTKARDSRHCGLGLAICREIMRTLGGRITASSGAGGHGATFTMWFPIQGETR
jgi:two-component system, NtrC family, sensor kinase